MIFLFWFFILRVLLRVLYWIGVDRVNRIDWMVFWDDGVRMRMKGYNKI